MPVGHISLPTGPSTFRQMRAFYLAILKPLGYTVYLENNPRLYGMASSAGPDFWLHCEDAELPTLASLAGAKPVGKTHVAFNAESRAAVDAWYQTAIEAGAISNGEPGERVYQRGYYAAYVLDPLGNNIEAVHFKPE